MEPTLAIPPSPAVEVAPAGQAAPDLRPRLTLALLSAQHALIHAQVAILPLVFIAILPLFRVGLDEVGLLLAAGNLLAGVAQLAYAPLSRVVTRRAILGVSGLVFGGAMAALGAAPGWLAFALLTVVARIGGAPQHPVGNALLAEQRPESERAGTIAVHIAIGNLGSVAVPLVGAAMIASAGWGAPLVAIGLAAIPVGLGILLLVRESGTDRAAALAHGSTLAGFAALRHERDLRWLFAASTIAAAGRGIGIVSTFVPLYLARVQGLDSATVALMYTVLLAGSVPGPIVAGRLADRYGHKPVLVGSYVLGAGALGLLVVAGSSIPLTWLAVGFVGAFVFEESSLLQALLVDVAPPALRDVAFSSYFTTMFVVGAAWSAAMGVLIAALGDAQGFPIAFAIMAASYLVAILAVIPIRAGGRPGPAGSGVTPPVSPVSPPAGRADTDPS